MATFSIKKSTTSTTIKLVGSHVSHEGAVVLRQSLSDLQKRIEENKAANSTRAAVVQATAAVARRRIHVRRVSARVRAWAAATVGASLQAYTVQPPL